MSKIEEGGRLLTEWARYQRGGNGRGYPAMEPFTRLVTPTAGQILIGPMPEEVAKTDRAVSKLKRRSNGELWYAIEQHYLKDDAAPVKWARLGKTRSGFYRLVDRAKEKVFDLVQISGNELRSEAYAA